MGRIVPSMERAEEIVCDSIGKALRNRARDYVISNLGTSAMGPILGWSTFGLILAFEVVIAALFTLVSTASIFGALWGWALVIAYFAINCE